MPELPDVEAILKYLRVTSLYKTIDNIQIFDIRIIKGDRNYFKNDLIGCSFQEAKRRGKFIMVKLDSAKYLIFHFGMTGNLKYFRNKIYMPPYTRILFSFQNGHNLAYISQFLKRLKNKSKTIKTLLMDQKFLAGIGNLYADEILFQARILPYRKAKDLNKRERIRLYKKIKEVLKEANKVNAAVWKLKHKFIIPHRYEDNICPKCGNKLKSIKIGNRTSFFCSHCQK